VKAVLATALIAALVVTGLSLWGAVHARRMAVSSSQIFIHGTPVCVLERAGEIRVAITGAGDGGVFRWPEAEAALAKRFSAKSLDGLAASADGLISDIHADNEYRAHLIGVMARRAVAAATNRSSEEAGETEIA